MKNLSILTLLALSLLTLSCGKDKDALQQPSIIIDTVTTNSPKAVSVLNQKPDANWHKPQSDSAGPQKRVEVKLDGDYAKVFNDSNYMQLAAAESVGITPISDLASTWNLKRPLVLIASCEEYYLEDLTHSFPFLVPEGAQLVKDIGARFKELLWDRAKCKYRIKVTSVLRTPETIKDLQKVNSNSVKNSAHSYGTTIDISYANFILDDTESSCSYANLAGLLAEVLHEFQSQGRCYVKYESKQSCFHLTVRPSK